MFGAGGLGRDMIEEVGGMGGNDVRVIEMDMVER